MIISSLPKSFFKHRYAGSSLAYLVSVGIWKIVCSTNEINSYAGCRSFRPIKIDYYLRHMMSSHYWIVSKEYYRGFYLLELEERTITVQRYRCGHSLVGLTLECNTSTPDPKSTVREFYQQSQKGPPWQ